MEGDRQPQQSNDEERNAGEPGSREHLQNPQDLSSSSDEIFADSGHPLDLEIYVQRYFELLNFK